MTSVFTVPFKYKGKHHCRVVVLLCQDFRFSLTIINKFLQEHLGLTEFDLIGAAGGAKTINDQEKLINFSLQVADNLHQVERIIIFNHADCGAYGGLKSFNGDKAAEAAHHHQELLKAKSRLSKQFPKQIVEAFFLKLNQDDSQLEFIPV